MQQSILNKKQPYISMLLTIAVLIFDKILQLHALSTLGIQNNGTIHVWNPFQASNIDPSTQDICSIECSRWSLRELFLHNNIFSICCWLMSADKSHKIYIDVNVAKLLGKGSWATVYDTHLHDDVKYNEHVYLIFVLLTLFLSFMI